MQLDTLRATLLKSALLGTERLPLTWPRSEDGGALADIVGRLDTADAEGTLLNVAAMVSLYRRAGQLPPTGTTPMPEPCPSDEIPTCNASAGHRLATMLRGDNRAVLPEWLEACGAAGLRVREEYLPELLEAGRRQTDLRAAIAPVLGRRGRWLAALNPTWAYVAGEPAGSDDETWQTGNKAARLDVLRRVRAQDPARGRELLAATWGQEPAKDRSDFLEVLAVGLSLEDEPFLEAALDDSRKETRAVAVELLARLPESRLVQRMIERTRPLLTVKRENALKKLLKGVGRIEVTLPQTYDKAMARDGIEEKPVHGAQRKLGEKAWWLQQMVGSVPPDVWCHEWQMNPADILAAARAGEWSEVLIEGFRRAALRYQATAWLEAFLSDAIGLKQFSLPEMTIGLPAARVEEFLLAALASTEGDLDPVMPLLQAYQQPWTANFSRSILDAMRRKVVDAPSYHVLHRYFKEAALFMPPLLLAEVALGWPTDHENWDYWRPAIDAGLAVLQFRRDMYEELNSPVT